MASQITGLMIVYSSVYSGADQRKHKSSASLAFVRGIHRRPVNSPHKGPVTWKMFPFDDVIMESASQYLLCCTLYSNMIVRILFTLLHVRSPDVLGTDLICLHFDLRGLTTSCRDCTAVDNGILHVY